MKKTSKRILILFLCFSLVLGCGVTAFAASKTAAEKLYDLSASSGYMLVPKDIDGKTITATTEDVDEDGANETVYAEVEKIELSFTGAADTQYAIFLLYNTQVPTDGNIRYIDQLPGVDGAMTATIFPDQIAAEGTYYVYVSTADAYTQVGSFKVAPPEYVLGDVNNDGSITANDASLVLQYLVDLYDIPEALLGAADFNEDGSVTANDASLILQYLVS